MSYRKIQAALETHLQAFGAENTIFSSHPHKPQNGSSYVVATFMPGKVKTVLLGPQMPKEHRGFLLINIHEGSEQAGIAAVDALCDHFEYGLELTFEGQDVRVEKTEAGPNRGNLNHTDIPLTIAWRSYF